MRKLALAALLPLGGCLAVIPVPDLRAGNACVPEGVKVGQKIPMKTGGMAIVEKLYGRSDRCRDALLPILADVRR